MAAFITRTVRSTSHETAVPSPANWPEMEKAIANVRQQLVDAGKVASDESVQTEARDGEIVLYWIEEQL